MEYKGVIYEKPEEFATFLEGQNIRQLIDAIRDLQEADPAFLQVVREVARAEAIEKITEQKSEKV